MPNPITGIESVACRVLGKWMRLLALVLFGGGTLAVPEAQAFGTIAWNSFVLSGDPVNLTSSDEIMDGEFVFQLGVFNPGFTPDPARKWEWESKWNPKATANYISATKVFSGSVFLTNQPVPNAPPFTVGAKAYIWGKRGTGNNAEWILFSNANWLWPLENDIDSNSSLNWRTREALQVILGTVNAPNGTPFLMKSAAVRVMNWPQFQSTTLGGEPLNGPNDDPDGDGVENLLEFAYDIDPLDASSVYHPEVIFTEISGQFYQTMTVEANFDHAVLLTVQVSPDLVNWFDGPTYTTVIPNPDGLLIVRDNTQFSTASKRFIRLKATLPPL